MHTRGEIAPGSHVVNEGDLVSYIQNWQTPKAGGTCYVVTMFTDDGSSLSAKFKLK